jgi:hypothetical protein
MLVSGSGVFMDFILGKFLNIQHQEASIPTARDFRSAPNIIYLVKTTLLLRLPLSK